MPPLLPVGLLWPNGRGWERDSEQPVRSSPTNSRFKTGQSRYFRFQYRRALAELTAKLLIFRKAQSHEFRLHLYWQRKTL